MAVVTQEELNRVAAERDAAKAVALECIRVLSPRQWSKVRKVLDERDAEYAGEAAVV